MELRLPAPCMVVLIGPSGAGKTTWAHQHFSANEVVSSDSLRAMVGIAEDDQQASTVAFELLNRIVDERMRRKLTVVVDTTGLDTAVRRDWVARAHAAGVPAHALLFDTPPEICEERNSAKPHPIPKSVLRNQVSRFEQTILSVEHDGFDGIHTRQPVAIVTPQVAATALTHAERALPSPRHTFGLDLSRFNWPEPDLAAQLVSVVQRAEAAGFRDVWLMDHFRQIPQVGKAWEDLPEAFTAVSYMAGHSHTVRLGVLVASVTHRHPVLTGKMIATLDVLSGGRALCGLGIGWDAKEHAAFGFEFPSTSRRYEILEDTLEMLPLLWGKGSPAFRGRTFMATELTCYPRPIQERIPIMIGGSGEKRTLRMAAKHADACNLFGDPDTIRDKVMVLERHCEELGRDPSRIEVTHLLPVVVAADRQALRKRVDSLRSRSRSHEEYARRNNAGTVDDLVTLFTAYSEAGARHSIVALPDVALEGSIETFGSVIEEFART